MESFLDGKRAVVTGGTRGIGRAVAEGLLRAGARVAICGRDAKATTQAATELASTTGKECVGLAADVSKWDAVSGFFESVGRRFGGLDIVVNNAGIGVFRSVAEMEPDEWDRVLNLNLSGAFYCVRAAVPLMRPAGGHLIQISSLAGKNPFAGGAAYNASKFGLNGFSEAIMQDLRYDNIRVSYIMPGSVDTDFTARAARAAWKIAPEDVAQVVLDLLRMPERTLVSRVEIRPSKPPK